MKKIFLLFIVSFSLKSFAQNKTIDSLKKLLLVAKADTERFNILSNLSSSYTYLLPDSAFFYAKEELSQALTSGDKELERGYIDMGRVYRVRGNYPQAFSLFLKSLSIAGNLKDTPAISIAYYYLGEIEEAQKNYVKALNDEYQSLHLNGTKSSWDHIQIASIHEKAGNLDSALYYATNAKRLNQEATPGRIDDWIFFILGNIYFKRGLYDTALQNYHTAIPLCIEQGNPKDLIDIYNGIAKTFEAEGRIDSAIYYAYAAFRENSTIVYPAGRLEATQSLADLYTIRKNADSVVAYLKRNIILKDSLFNLDKSRQIENLSFNDRLNRQELAAQQQQNESKLHMYALLAIALIILIVAFFLYRNNRHKQKAYTLLQKQKEEIDKQKREADIEAALERVRGKAMAMQDSSELAELVDTLYKELAKLDFALTWCMINIIDENTSSATIWLANYETGKLPESYHLKFADFPYPKAMWQAWKERKIKWTYEESGAEKETYENYLLTETEFSRVPEAIKAQMKATGRYLSSFTFANFGGLQTVSNEPLSDSNFDILVRFGNVFDQTYTRFLDLKKAEAQAKEAQIQLSLERVRARAMAMHHSNELFDLLTVLIDQFDVLGICPPYAHLSIIDEATNSFSFKISGNIGNRILAEQVLDINASPIWKQAFENWKKGEYYRINSHHFPKETLPQTFEMFRNILAMMPHEARSKIEDFPDGIYVTEASCRFGFLGYGHSRESTLEEKNIVIRFVKEFEQSYQRFLDLQKAEAQAKEAKIEASLERVRGKAMAMHSSEDVGDATVALFNELDKLEISTLRCGIIIFDESETMEVWTAGPNKEGKTGRIIGKLDANIHPMLEEAYATWKQKKSFNSYELAGENMLNYYKAVSTYSGYPIPPDMEAYYNLILNQHSGGLSKEEIDKLKQYCSIFFFKEGGLFTFTKDELAKETCRVLEKFTAVFALTYHRYLELKQAESNAKEALSRASIDRVRAEIASMRSMNDLQKITPLIWNELTTLGVPFIRCGVFIINDQAKTVHSYLSTPDGKAIAAFELSFGSSEFINKLLKSWNNNEILIDYWDEATFLKWTETLVEEGIIQSSENYITGKLRSGLHLHLVPFLQGMLYVGNNAALKIDEIKLIELLANAFSTAYARYEDFNKLEIAKQQVEFTLQELKSTQSQLIQSEKMASLGELTAGIAHEIQNPLNFVNNFSEVNRELIEEVKSQKSKLKSEELDDLLNDIAANEEKINYHGKRADAIVKNMLQHSRQTKGVKEPTDINALCDEYLRLSYHGLCAKDKNFNADLTTDFDDTIEKINIVPQDIGRVLLNLFNNAFYATNEKQKAESLKQNAEYKPLVSVQTKKLNDKVEIRVNDNGNGIPSSVKDKIFQPFFTTKPTGEGTGLGLSLSYDIIKAHGGEIKVETKEGEDSEFIIQLSLTTIS